MCFLLEEGGNPITEDRELSYNKTVKKRKFVLNVKLTFHTIKPITNLQAKSDV
jgi:hypothetical protein